MAQERDNTTQEFENLIREHSPLDIPLSTLENVPDSSNLPAASAQSLIDLPVVPGTVPTDITVTSVFDTRPINAYDAIFNVLVSHSDGDFLKAGLNPVSILVPDGYVVVIRGVKLFVDPIPSISIHDSDYLLSLLVNNVAVANYTDIPVGTVINNFLPAHSIAGENQTFGIQYNVLAAIAPLFFQCFVQFHCNVLIASGVPTPFIIGNQKQPQQPASLNIPSSQPSREAQYQRYLNVINEAVKANIITDFQASVRKSAVYNQDEFNRIYNATWWNNFVAPLIIQVKNKTGNML